MASLGSRIAEARKYIKITQKELARRLGVVKSTISGYESGSRRPDADMLLKIAHELDVSVDHLLGNDRVWIDTLPPDLQKFAADPNNTLLLRMAKDVKETGILPETMMQLARALVADAKERIDRKRTKP